MQSKILKGALTAAVTQDEYSTVFNKNESFEGCCTWKKKHEVFVISFMSCSRIRFLGEFEVSFASKGVTN